MFDLFNGLGAKVQSRAYIRRMRWGVVLLIGVSLLGCRFPSRHKADAGSTTSSGAHPHNIPTVPAGYVTATVLDVVPSRSGDVVLLSDDTGRNVLPIYIGGTEAMTIKLRMEGKK